MRLNLGSGYKYIPGYVNIDIRKEVKPDMVVDISQIGLPFKSNTAEEVRAFDFLEHIPLGRTVFVMEEIYRVLLCGGRFESFTPDAEKGQGAFQDPTHLSFWVENSWLYYRHLFNTIHVKRLQTDRSVWHLHVLAIKNEKSIDNHTGH